LASKSIAHLKELGARNVAIATELQNFLSEWEVEGKETCGQSFD